MPIRVVLAEDNALLRHGLARLIDSAADLELVGAAADLAGCLAMVEEHQPDVVVTDIRMPPSHTDEGLTIAARHPGTGVVLLSQYAEATYALALLAEGSARRGYLLKERVADGDELADAIRRVAAGGSVIDPTVVEGLVAANKARPSRLDSLTPRELEVLRLLPHGLTNREIASRLFISPRTAQTHIQHIYAKLGVASRAEAAAYAVAHRLS